MAGSLPLPVLILDCSRADLRRVVDHAIEIAVRLHYGARFVSADSPDDLDPAVSQVFPRFSEHRPFVERELSRILARRTADDALDSRPERRSEAHRAGLARCDELVATADASSKRVSAEPGLRQHECDDFGVQRRIVERHDEIHSGRNNTAARRIENCRAEWSARTLRDVSPCKRDGNPGSILVQRIGPVPVDGIIDP